MSRFQMLGKLGEGGMGIVFEAHDRERDMRVALKTLRHLDAGSLYRFKREFRALAGLDHPNIVSLYELISHRDSWFFTMEVIRGLQLMDYLHHREDYDFADETTDTSRQGTITGSGDWAYSGHPGLATAGAGVIAPDAAIREVADVVDLGRLRPALAQLASALQALHSAGFIHRDLKPSNIRVTDEDRVVLMDFGVVARALQRSGKAAGGSRTGTPGYMAPEQVARAPLSPAADWYAFGVILFESLTDQLPFSGPPAAVMAAKSNVDAPRPSQLVRGVPADLDDLAVCLLAREPDARLPGMEVLRRLGAADGPKVRAQAAEVLRGRAFVGRDAELTRLQRAYHQVAEGAARCVLVTGLSGIGKTRLVEHFVDEIAKHEITILSGACHERETMACKAFDGVLDDVARLLRALPADEREPLIPESIEFLTEMFPVLLWVPYLYAPNSADGIDREQRFARALAGFRDLMGRLAKQRPLVVRVEDLQWADGNSLRFLTSLFEPDPIPGLMLVLVTRAAKDSPGLADVLDPMTSRSWFTHIELGCLSDDEQRALAGQLTDFPESLDGVGQSAWRDIAGHPLLLVELTRYLDAIGGRRFAPPMAFSEVIDWRLATLDDNARAVMEVLAVADRPTSLVLAADICRLSGAATERARRALCNNNLAMVVRVEPGVWLDCRYPHVRTAVVGQLSPERLRTIHLGLAQTLSARREASAATVAGHYAAAGILEAAVRHLVRAAHQAVTDFSLDRAIELYHKAADIIGPDESQPVLTRLRCHIHIGLTRCMRVVDDIDAGLAELARAHRLAAEHDLLEELAEIHFWRGSLLFLRADVPGCLAEHQKGRQYARRSGSLRRQVQAFSGVADGFYLRGRMLTAHEHYATCLELCRKHDFPDLMPGNMAMLGWTRYFRNELSSALDECHAAMAAAVDSGEWRVEVITRCVMLGPILWEMDQLDAARMQLEVGLDQAREIGTRRFEGLALTGLGMVFHELGEAAAAGSAARQGLALARAVGMEFTGPWALAVLARTCPDENRAQDLLREGEELLARADISHNHLFFRRLAIDVCLHGTRLDEAERHALELQRYTGSNPLPWCHFFIDRAHALVAVARARQESGNTDVGIHVELQQVLRQAEARGFALASRALRD